MRNFYLVQAGCLYGDTYYLPYAVGMLAAFALNDKTVNKEYRLGGIVYTLEDIDSAIASFENPALVGFSNSIWNYEYNLEFAKKLKQAYPDCLIEFGIKFFMVCYHHDSRNQADRRCRHRDKEQNCRYCFCCLAASYNFL